MIVIIKILHLGIKSIFSFDLTKYSLWCNQYQKIHTHISSWLELPIQKKVFDSDQNLLLSGILKRKLNEIM